MLAISIISFITIYSVVYKIFKKIDSAQPVIKPFKWIHWVFACPKDIENNVIKSY